MTKIEEAAINRELELGNILTVEEYRTLKGLSVKDCRNCDGSGIFYGNVCVCGCVSLTEEL